jgi:hypothetical protein
MRRFLANVNPLVRGLAVVALIALVVIVLNPIARIAFPLAIAFFLFMLCLREVKALWTLRHGLLTRSRPSWRILVAARHLDGWADALTRVHGEPLMRCEYGYGEKCTNPAKEVVVLFHDGWADVGDDDYYIWIACVCGVHKREGMTRRQVVHYIHKAALRA